jgi:hypothetical protein
MASLVCLLLEKQLGLHFIPQPRAAICPPPSRAAPPTRLRGTVVRRMDARRSKGENDTFQHVMDGRNGERPHFLVTAQTNQVALEAARVLERACFREATGDPKNARQAGMTSAASNFLPDLTAACAVPARHSCDAAAVRSFTLSTHSFTLSCCGQRLSPWTMPHDPEIFRNEELQK